MEISSWHEHGLAVLNALFMHPGWLVGRKGQCISRSITWTEVLSTFVPHKNGCFSSALVLFIGTGLCPSCAARYNKSSTVVFIRIAGVRFCQSLLWIDRSEFHLVLHLQPTGEYHALQLNIISKYSRADLGVQTPCEPWGCSCPHSKQTVTRVFQAHRW